MDGLLKEIKETEIFILYQTDGEQREMIMDALEGLKETYSKILELCVSASARTRPGETNVPA